MTGLAVYIVAAALAQPLEVRLAPDHPAPLFFIDEPLVVQFESDSSYPVSAEFSITLPNGERTVWSIENLSLTAGRPAWHAIDSLPVLRGPYQFRVKNDPGSLHEGRDWTLTRIDRPDARSSGITGVHLGQPGQATMYALRCLPVAFVRLDWDTPNLPEVVRTVIANTPGRLYVRVAYGAVKEQPTWPHAAQEIAPAVDLWEIAGADGVAEYAALARDIRRADPGALLAARLSTARDSIPLLRADPLVRPDVLVVSPDAVEAVEQATERAGIEGIELLVEFDPPLSPDTALAPLVSRLLRLARTPHHEVIVPQRLLENRTAFSDGLPVLAGASRQFEGAELLGAIDADGNNRAWLYHRAVDETAQWLVALTFTDPNEPAPIVDVSSADSWTLTDAYGNVRAASGTAGAELGDPPGYGLWFVRGSGGTVLLDAYIRRMQRHAAATLPHEGALQSIAPDAIAALHLLRNYAYPAPTRLQFFNIVRALPAIEEAWHRGIIETRDAVPLARHFAAIARELAAIKQEAGEQLIEPLERTLSNCRELLGAFPEAEEGADAKRVAFLHNEVERLLDEALVSEAAGRQTEAKALAALAEWRARSLEPAATIPVVEPEEDLPPDAPEADSQSDNETQPEDSEN